MVWASVAVALLLTVGAEPDKEYLGTPCIKLRNMIGFFFDC